MLTKRKGSSIYILLLSTLMVGMSACKMNIEAPSTSGSTSSATSATVAIASSCTDLLKYSTLVACQTTTGANCSSSLEKFTNGSSTTCYTPASGYEVCNVTPPTWEYTAYTVQSLTVDGYLLQRSLLGCSSEICMCPPPPAPTASDPTPLEKIISALPATCTTTNCSPYVYQGAVTISSIPFVLTTNPIASGLPATSSDTHPTFRYSGTAAGLSNFIFKIYLNSSCSGAALGTMTFDAHGAATTTPLTVTGKGMKNFYVSYKDPNLAAYSACIDTQKSYYLVEAPVLAAAPTPAIFPLNEAKTGVPITLDYHATDNTGVTYTCKYDRVVDNSDVVSSDCSTLPGALFSSSGVLTWTPQTSAYGAYEFHVVGTNAAGSYPIQHTAVDVIPSTLVLSGLAHYYDAQFSKVSGGANINPSASWKDLIGVSSVDGTLKNTTGTILSGWTTGGHSVRLNGSPENNPTGDVTLPYPAAGAIHEDYVDLGKTTFLNQSITLDMWINAKARPLTTTSALFYNDDGSGNCTIAPFCGGAGCSSDTSGGCGVLNNYPAYGSKGMIFNYYDPTNADSSFNAYVRDNGAGTSFNVVLDLRKADGSYTTQIVSSSTFNYNTWYHVTAIWNQISLTKTLYVNGVSQGNVAEAAHTDPLLGIQRQMFLGVDTDASSNRFNGEIANFRIYDGANSTVSSNNYNAEKQQFP